MKYIKVSDEEFERLKEMAIPYMEPEDTVNDGIRKLIRDKLGIEVEGEERTVENLLNGLREPYKYLAKELIKEIENIGDVEITLPTPKAWIDGYRWVTFKKVNPKGRRENIGWIEPRGYGFQVSVYDSEKGDYTVLKIGKDVTIPEVKIKSNDDFDVLTAMTEEEVKAIEEYRKVKDMILNAFKKAHQVL